jgi:SAM-dependent methyltransferase
MRVCSSCDKTFEGKNWQCPYCFYEPQKIEGHFSFAPELAKESEGFEASYFARLAQLEAGNFWFKSRNRLLIWALQRYFPNAKNFLEIGCGTGFVLSGIREVFPKLILSGSEIFSEGLNFAAERLPGVELLQMDARRIPFREEFDVIGAFDVLEHVKEDEKVLEQMYQATRARGGIMLTVPQHSFLWSDADEYARHVRRYSARDLRVKVERAGFEVLRVTSFVSLLLPLMLISRLKLRSKQSYDPSAEITLSRPVNAIFEQILAVERAMIRLGVSFPIGGSLLLIGRRS